MGKSLHALLIAEAEPNPEVLVNELRRLGYEVEFERVETVEALRRALREDTWHVVLGEYRLPGLSAAQAVEVLRAQGLDLPFLLIPGPIHSKTVVAVLQAGSNEFIVRGNFAELGSLLDQELQAVQARQGRQSLPVEDLFERAFHLSPVGSCITGLDGRLKNVSQSLLDMLGFTQAELVGKHFNEITHPDDLPLGREAVGRMLSGELSSVSFEKRYLHKSGELVWALVSSSLLRDSSGQPVHFLAHILNITERKQAEAALRESEQKYSVIFEKSAVPAALSRIPEGVFVDINEAFQRTFGYSKQDVIGRTSLEIGMFRPEERQRTIEQVRQHGAVHDDEKLVFTRSGEPRIASVHVGIVEFGGEKYAITTAQDVTGRKRAEAAMLESEARYQRILDAMMEGCQIIDFDWRYIYVNDVVARQGRHSPAELLNRTMMEVYPGIEQTELFSVLRQCMEDRVPRRMENQFIFPDGSPGWFELSIQPAREGIFILSTDITERKRAEERFRLIVESAPNAMLLVDQEGRIEMANSQTETFFGYTRAELIGLHVDQLVPERVRTAHRVHRQGYFPEPKARAMGAGRDLYGVRRDGSEFPVEIGLTPIATREGMLVMATIVDITARKQAEQALERRTEDLRRSNAELEQFAYVSSHDLQEPLRMVSSYVQLLAKRYRGRLDPDADEFIGFAVEGAARMQQLINDLLAYSRVGTHTKPFQPTDFEAVLEDALDNLQIAIRESEALITHDPLPTLPADHVQMVQLLQNLIGNAIKFRDKPPRIHIHASRDGADWLFSVRDNGLGIDPKFSERIFIIFQRLNTRAEYAGTGIGLAICKKIVERHGGRIWVEPAPDQGSIFRFTVPEQGGLRDIPVETDRYSAGGGQSR